MRTTWGSSTNALDPLKDTPGSFVEGVILFAYLIGWSLTMVAYLTIFFLTTVVTLLLIIVGLPFVFWRKVSPKDKSQMSAPAPTARPVQ
ncbi:MAG: hypothetical protein QUS33_10890 [Dehalococcoidia bacterium]|nr:hypothetical protein [Dehalococcoidia bacterium]